LTLTLLLGCSSGTDDETDGAGGADTGGTSSGGTSTGGATSSGGSSDGSGGTSPVDTLDDVDWELGGLNADLPNVATDCRTTESFGCLHFSGEVNGESVSETCPSGGMASVETAFFCGPNAALQNGEVFEIRLTFGSLEPGRAFDIVAGASEHPIKFEWVSESFKTHSLSGYLLDATHDQEVRISGLHIETTKENGDVSERVTGTFAASWIPKADCSDNCVSIRIRGEFSSITKL